MLSAVASWKFCRVWHRPWSSSIRFSSSEGGTRGRSGVARLERAPMAKKDKNDDEEKHEKKPRDRRHGVLAVVNGQFTYTGSLPRDPTGLSKPKQETADQDSTRNAGDLKGTTKNNDYYESSSSSGNNKGNHNWKKYDDHDNYKDNKGYKNNDWKNQKKDDWKSDKEWKNNSNWRFRFSHYK